MHNDDKFISIVTPRYPWGVKNKSVLRSVPDSKAGGTSPVDQAKTGPLSIPNSVMIVTLINTIYIMSATRLQYYR
jgi:hypothetical protein